MRLQIAREWLSRGIAVDFVLCNARGELLAEVPKSGRIIDLQAPRVRNAVAPLVRYLKKERPNALLAAMWPLTVVAPLAARLAGFGGRVVISEHAPQSLSYVARGRLHNGLMAVSMRLLYPRADARVAVSAGVADDMALLSKLPRERFSVVHNPAATGKVGKHPRPQVLAAANRPLILSVGTMKAVKRHDLLIDAFATLLSQREATLCILGEGAMRGALEAQVERLGLQGMVLLPGYVADPTPWYAAADLFVLSSDYEGFGNVLVEAMEHGLPIVSTDCPVGPREILADGKYGSLVPVGEPAALASAMLAAVGKSHNRIAIRARAADFGVGKAADAYLRLLMPMTQEGSP
jgi:glycosyltransferase involved in cell wall biosynthesis